MHDFSAAANYLAITSKNNDAYTVYNTPSMNKKKDLTGNLHVIYTTTINVQ